MLVYCFDLDGVICGRISDDAYDCTEPRMNIVEHIRRLYKDGNYIKIYTGRGNKTGKDWKELTTDQLKEWGVPYHELIMNKPYYDIYIDDKCMHINQYIKEMKI